LRSELIELRQAAELTVEAPGVVDHRAERGHGPRIDRPRRDEAAAKLFDGAGRAVVVGKAELGVGPAVDLAKQSSVLR
jgi:hypothetical protein